MVGKERGRRRDRIGGGKSRCVGEGSGRTSQGRRRLERNITRIHP